MSGSLGSDEYERYLERLAELLERARLQRQTLTYLQAAEALAVPGPKRIHKTTRLLETLLVRDAEAGRPLRAALVISRASHGLPGRGFFDHAQRLGLHDGRDPEGFHARLLAELFAGHPG